MKTELLNTLENTLNELIERLSLLNQKEFNTVPFKDSWTAGQLADHLLKSYGLIEILHGPVKTTDRAYNAKVPDLEALFLNFDLKMQSPEFIIPSAALISKESLIAALEIKKKEFITAANSLDLSETCLAFTIPEFEAFTRFEWISFAIIHTKRHIKQLKNIIKALTKAH